MKKNHNLEFNGGNLRSDVYKPFVSIILVYDEVFSDAIDNNPNLEPVR